MALPCGRALTPRRLVVAGLACDGGCPIRAHLGGLPPLPHKQCRSGLFSRASGGAAGWGGPQARREGQSPTHTNQDLALSGCLQRGLHFPVPRQHPLAGQGGRARVTAPSSGHQGCGVPIGLEAAPGRRQLSGWTPPRALTLHSRCGAAREGLAQQAGTA